MQDMVLTETQILLRESTDRHVAGLPAGPEQAAGGEAWRGMADTLGIAGLTVTEEHGGLGCGAVEAMVVAERLGTGLAAEPFVSTAIAAATLLGGCGEAGADLSVRIASGQAIVVAALGRDCAIAAERDGAGWRLEGTSGIVACGAAADAVILPARDKASGDMLVFVADCEDPALNRQDCRLLDRNPAARFTVNSPVAAARVLACEDSSAQLARARDAAHAAHAAELAGIMERMLGDTVEYTSQRVQFGQPLARFQVLQHRMAAMHVELEMARSMALMAALAIGDAPAGRGRAVSAALARNLAAAREVANGAVQLHGGIGVTEELALGRYFRRVRTLASLLGTAESHIDAFASLAGD